MKMIKKIFTLSLSCIILAGALSSCNKNEVNSETEVPQTKIDQAGGDSGKSLNGETEVLRAELQGVVRLDVDRLVPGSAEQLEDYSSVIIVGTVTEQLDSVREEPSGLGMTYYNVEVEQVLYGAPEDNETTVKIWQSWWLSKDRTQIETFSELEPLEVGDRRILALNYSDAKGCYSISCDSDGCMPVPDVDILKNLDSGTDALESMKDSYGAYEEKSVRLGYYRDVLLRYKDNLI